MPRLGKHQHVHHVPVRVCTVPGPQYLGFSIANDTQYGGLHGKPLAFRRLREEQQRRLDRQRQQEHQQQEQEQEQQQPREAGQESGTQETGGGAEPQQGAATATAALGDGTPDAPASKRPRQDGSEAHTAAGASAPPSATAHAASASAGAPPPAEGGASSSAALAGELPVTSLARELVFGLGDEGGAVRADGGFGDMGPEELALFADPRLRVEPSQQDQVRLGPWGGCGHFLRALACGVMRCWACARDAPREWCPVMCTSAGVRALPVPGAARLPHRPGAALAARAQVSGPMRGGTHLRTHTASRSASSRTCPPLTPAA